MAKARKPSKKKKAATDSRTKKKAATKKVVKKAIPKKKAAKRKAAKKAVKKIAPKKKLRRTASRPSSTVVDSGAESGSVEVIPKEPKCKCEERDGLFFLLVKQKNGKYKESPLHAPFETLEKCEAKCKPE